jgi:hypothetical protein
LWSEHLEEAAGAVHRQRLEAAEVAGLVDLADLADEPCLWEAAGANPVREFVLVVQEAKARWVVAWLLWAETLLAAQALLFRTAVAVVRPSRAAFPVAVEEVHRCLEVVEAEHPSCLEVAAEARRYQERPTSSVGARTHQEVAVVGCRRKAVAEAVRVERRAYPCRPSLEVADRLERPWEAEAVAERPSWAVERRACPSLGAEHLAGHPYHPSSEAVLEDLEAHQACPCHHPSLGAVLGDLAAHRACPCHPSSEGERMVHHRTLAA